MRIFITGGKGRLGTALQGVLSAHGHEITAVDLDELDISDFNALRTAVREAAPEVVINSAAWTDVDGCARDPQRAIVMNGLGAQNVALAAAAVGAAVVQISTNEVFDGRLRRPYTEYDTTSAVNAYGESKLYGERAVASVNPRHYIVRTAWLFAHGGKNFIQSILRAAGEGKPLRVVTDEVANPTYTDDLADAVAQLIATERYGIYHFVNAGATSRYSFARYALDKAGFADTPLQGISRHQWQRPSTPPSYTPLVNLAGAQIGIVLRPWQQAVDAFLEREASLANV